MCVHASKLICSTGVLNFQTFKLMLSMYNNLRLHAAIESQRVFDVILSLIQPSEAQSVNFEGQQWWTVKSKSCTQRKQSLDKIRSIKFCQ